MSTKTALFFVALLLFALDFALKMEPTPLTEAEKAEIRENTTFYYSREEGTVMQRTIFKAPKDKPIFWICREDFFWDKDNYQFKTVYPVLKIDFGDTLRERYNKRKAEQVSTE